jgi:hypothetical protein
MHTATATRMARHPATGAFVLALGVATASWAMTQGSMSELRRRLTAAVPRLFTREGTPFPPPAPLPPILASESLWASIGWTLTVLAWAAVCWLATSLLRRSGRGRLPATVGSLAVALQCALAIAPLPWLVTGVSWPGPTQPFTLSTGELSLDLRDPSILAPVVVVLALVVAAWWATPGSAPARPDPSPRLRQATRRALLVVGVPAVGLWLGAVTALVGTGAHDWATRSSWLPAAAVEPGGSLALVIAAAIATSGGGRAQAVVLAGAQLAVTVDLVCAWSRGGSDLLLLASALSAGATACAAAWRPAARALAELADGPREIAMAPGTTKR